MWRHPGISLALIFALLRPLTVMGQAGSVSAGGDGSGPGGSMAWSVGQVGYTVIGSPSATLSAGVQQAYEVSVVNKVPGHVPYAVLSVAPNPAYDMVWLIAEPPLPAQASYRLTDAQGRTLASGTLHPSRTAVPLRHQAPGVYLLHVLLHHHHLRTFRILKH
jgi:hypothetical protein